jgi:hypothetical protein
MKAKLVPNPFYRISVPVIAPAHQALLVEDKIGVMLPCNVIVRNPIVSKSLPLTRWRNGTDRQSAQP